MLNRLLEHVFLKKHKFKYNQVFTSFEVLLMQRKTIILIVACIIVIVAVPLFATVSSFALNWSKSVVRNFDTPDEEHALAAAEAINYASIVLHL
jgi:predicted PurR-regulated permease PerM